MIDNGIIGVGFGAYFGILFHAKHHPGLLQRPLLPNEGKHRPLLRVLVGLAIYAPICLLYLLGTDQIDNIYVLMVLKTFTPAFVSGFLLFGVMDRANMRLGLLDLQDPLIQRSLVNGSDDLLPSVDGIERESAPLVRVDNSAGDKHFEP